RTLRRLYLDPLARRVSDYGGAVYPAYPGIFRLMIDIKNEGPATWEVLRAQLASYDWLLRGEGAAVQVFISGDRPVETILADKDRLAGVDGRPSDLGKGIPALRMPVISESYPSLVKWKGTGAIPPAEMAILTDLCKRAHAEGKMVRLWATPENEVMWQTLRNAGVDLLNADDLDRLQTFLTKP
ncbi:MAG: histidinol-phosphatase, partial [Bacteroidetes bacterium]